MHYVTHEDYGLVHHQKIKLTKEVKPCMFTAAISPQEQSKKKIKKTIYINFKFNYISPELVVYM